MSNATALKEPVKEMPAESAETVSGSWLPETSEPTTPADDNASSGVMELFRKYASVSDLLRYAGVISVAVAMGLFLIDGAALFTDLQRFLTMLGFTGALTAAGFMMSLVVKEQRGSRAFMMLSLLSVPVNFTVFGALLYSFVPLDGLAQSYPGFALWQAGPADVLTALAAGLAVLLPVVWMGHTVLARTERNWLTPALLLSSAVLIVPVRQEIMVAVMAVATASALWWCVSRNNKDSLALKTIEGKFATALLFVPPIVLIARGLFLYDASGVLVFMLSAGVYLIFRQMLAVQKMPKFLTGTGTLVTAIAAVVTSAAGANLVNELVSEDLAVVLGVGGFLMLSHDLLQASPNQRLAKALGIVAVILSACTLTALSMFHPEAMITALCIATLVVVTTYGFMRSYIAVSIVAMLGIATISMMHVETLWEMAMQTGWWGIATAGVVAIVAGSLIDRAGTVVVKQV